METQIIHSKDDFKNLSIHTMAGALRVLVVEDDKSQWPLWENILSGLNRPVEVDWTTTEEAASLLLRTAFERRCQYDLVISDIYLAGPNTGIEIWNKYGEAAKNFIFVSGQPGAKIEFSKKLNFGNPLLFEKPISTEKLKNVISAISQKTQGGQSE